MITHHFLFPPPVHCWVLEGGHFREHCWVPEGENVGIETLVTAERIPFFLGGGEKVVVWGVGETKK